MPSNIDILTEDISDLDAKLAPYTQHYAGVVVRPTITRNGDGTVTVGSNGIYALYTNDTPSVIGRFSCAGGTFTLTEGATHYLLARYSGGSASLLWTTDRSQVEGNFRTVIPIETLYLFGGEIHGDSWDEAGHALAEKMLNRLVNTSRYVRDEIDGGLALGELTGRIVTISSGSVWRGVEKTQLAAFNSSSGGRLLLHVWNGTSWTVSQVTQYDNSNYQGASGLVALQNTNRYSVNWIFRTGGDDADCVMVLGTGDYTIDQALASGVPSNLPALATKHGFLVGRIIVAKNAASAYRIESAFTTGFQSGAVNDHGALSNLQGGTIGEYYHQSYAQWLRNQSPNTANNVAVVGNDGKLLPELVPDVAVVDFLGEVSSQSAMLTLVGQKGDWCTRTDLGTNWQVVGNDSSQLASWRQLTYPQSPVNSVFGETGAITAKAAHYASFYLGLHAVADDSAKLGGQLPSYYSIVGHTHSGYEAAIGNPSDNGYLLSSTTAGVRSWVAPYSHPATHAQSVIDSSTGWITDALAGKQPTIAAGTTSQYYRGDKTFQDFATSVRAAILTGLNTSKLSSREVLSTDSLLSAIGLLQGQLTSIVEQNYYAQAGDTKLEIPLSYTGTGTGVLTLRLLSDIAQTATIDGAGRFYSDSAGTLNESTSLAMSANAWTTFYIKVPSGTCNVTIPNGYAIRAFGDSSNNLVDESINGPKINGLSTSKIRSDVLCVYLYTPLDLGILSGQTYPWLNATSVFFSGNALTLSGVTYPWINATLVYFLGGLMTLSGVTYPWLNATTVLFAGNAITLSGVTYPWVNVTLVYFFGNAMTLSGVTYPWVNATLVVFSGNALTISGVTYPWLNATAVLFSGNALTISGVTYPWVNVTLVYFYGNSLTIVANISTSALYSGTGNFDLYIDGTGMQVTYPTSRAWPVNISRIYLRPSTGSMPSVDVDRLFNDLDATPGLTAVGSKLLDLRGNCGAVTAASATARANLAAKGFTVSFNV